MTNHSTPSALEQGYALLISVIVLGSVAGVLAVSVLLSGSTLLQTGVFVEDGEAARALADACAEMALQEIHDNTNFSGNSTIAFANGECEYSVSRLQGKKFRIETIGRSDQATQRVLVLINSIDPRISLTSWEEVTIF